MAVRKYTSIPLADRFWPKVDKSGGPDSCWPWIAGKVGGTGYGKIQGEGGASGPHLRAHRVSWELSNGPVPDGKRVLHRCDNPPCCNPAHLFLGTDADNQHDMRAKGRFVPKMGEQHYYAKLNEHQVQEIRRDPRTLREIAADYGLGQNSVSQIKRRITWKHVL